MNQHVIEGPQPPEYMKVRGSLAAMVRTIWLRDNNPHLYWHEEVRLAKNRLSAHRRKWGEHSGYVRDALKNLDLAEAGLDKYHADHF